MRGGIGNDPALRFWEFLPRLGTGQNVAWPEKKGCRCPS